MDELDWDFQIDLIRFGDQVCVIERGYFYRVQVRVQMVALKDKVRCN